MHIVFEKIYSNARRTIKCAWYFNDQSNLRLGLHVYLMYIFEFFASCYLLGKDETAVISHHVSVK